MSSHVYSMAQLASAWRLAGELQAALIAMDQVLVERIVRVTDSESNRAWLPRHVRDVAGQQYAEFDPRTAPDLSRILFGERKPRVSAFLEDLRQSRFDAAVDAAAGQAGQAPAAAGEPLLFEANEDESKSSYRQRKEREVKQRSAESMDGHPLDVILPAWTSSDNQLSYGPMQVRLLGSRCRKGVLEIMLDGPMLQYIFRRIRDSVLREEERAKRSAAHAAPPGSGVYWHAQKHAWVTQLDEAPIGEPKWKIVKVEKNLVGTEASSAIEVAKNEALQFK